MWRHKFQNNFYVWELDWGHFLKYIYFIEIENSNSNKFTKNKLLVIINHNGMKLNDHRINLPQIEKELLGPNQLIS